MARDFNQLDDLTTEVIQDFTVLLSELSSSFDKKDADEKADAVKKNLTSALESDNTFVMVYQDPETRRIVSTATGNLVLSHGEGWVDDVVTLSKGYRGQGLGRASMQALHDRFRYEGTGIVRLTSSHEREAAGNLYTDMGYEEGGEVWRATTIGYPEKLWSANTALNFPPVNCPIPTGDKAWAYPPSAFGTAEGMAEDLRATKYLMAITGKGSINHFVEESNAELTQALQQADFEKRATRLYTLDLDTVR